MDQLLRFLIIHYKHFFLKKMYQHIPDFSHWILACSSIHKTMFLQNGNDK